MKSYKALFRLLVVLIIGVVSQTVFISDAQNRKETVMIEMPDGVALATDVYRPDGDSVYPALLMRTPYGRETDVDIAEAVNEYGIVFVAQDVRGRFDSEGAFSMFRHDQSDGHATIDWIVQQPWSNGIVATVGASAGSIAQYLLAPEAGEALVCQWLSVGTPDMQASVYQNGAYRSGLIEGWLNSMGEYTTIDDVRQHATDDSWWASTDITQDFADVNVTAIHIGGWYDIFAQHTIDAFLGYQNESQQPDNQFLIMGVWTHSINEAEIGELFIENALFEDYEQFLSLWLQACLLTNNPETLADVIPPVTYFTMGAVDEDDAPGNEWHTASTWPPSGGVDTPLYLSADNTLGRTINEAGGGDSFIYDPDDPVPTVCGANLAIPAGACDQRAIEGRDDVLVYETDILDAPLEVTGDIKAQIWIETDVADTDIVVRITDVYPDGRSLLVVDGIMRARYHASPDFSTAVSLNAGEPTLLEFEVAPTSYIFNAGHRIRVSVTSSNAPRFAPNLNTGAMFLNEGDDVNIATTTILWGDLYPSAIILPVHE